MQIIVIALNSLCYIYNILLLYSISIYNTYKVSRKVASNYTLEFSVVALHKFYYNPLFKLVYV